MELFANPVRHDDTYRKEAHMILKIEGDRLQGNGGCNSFVGSYELKSGNRIAFSHIVATQMACANMDIESQFLKALNTADSYLVRGDTLTLNRARMAPLARFEAVYMK